MVASEYMMNVAVIINDGRIFLIISIILGCVNDVLSKCMIDHISSEEIVFFRFFVGAVVLIPFMKRANYVKLIKGKNSFLNCVRAILGVISIWLCTYSLLHLKLVEITMLMWTIPLFELFLSWIFFRDKATNVQILSAMICFTCIVGFSFNSVSMYHYQFFIFPLVAAVLFAIQDIIIKKIGGDAKQDINALFLFSVVASMGSFCFIFHQGLSQILWRDVFFLIALGICSNLTQYFLFVAFRNANLSYLALTKYLEFTIQIIFGYLFFSEIPSIANVTCAMILIISITIGNRSKKLLSQQHPSILKDTTHHR